MKDTAMSENSPVGETTANQVEDIIEQDNSSLVHAKSYLLVVAVNLIYVAQLVNIVGSGALARNITAVAGGADKIVWFTSAITILTTVLSPPVSQAADYWGRKWFLVFFTWLGFAGSIIVSRANTIGVVLVGFIFSGFSFGAQALIPTISSEIVPRRIRPYAQAFVNSAGCLSALVSLLFGGALVRNGNNEGFRIHFYIAAGLYALSALLCMFLYNPPPRDLQVELKFREKIKKLDWPAYFLLAVGIVLFCVGLSWSQNPYPWSNAHVSAPFAIGVVFLIGLVLYSWLLKKDGMIHHRLFQHRNFPIALGCIFVEGLCFFSANNYIPLEAAVLFTTDPVLIGAHLSVALAAAIVISGVAALYMSKTKTLRPMAMLAYLLFIIYYVLAATITTSTPQANFWGYPVFLGAGIGMCVASLITAAQFATPMELIATTTGLVIAVRGLGGAVGLAMFNAVYNHGLAANLGTKIAAATLPLGLPETSLGLLAGALLSGNPKALAEIPGITPTIIAAGGLAVQESLVIALRYVWVTAGAFSAAGLVASFFIVDPKSSFNAHVDAPVETDQHLLHPDKAAQA